MIEFYIDRPQYSVRVNAVVVDGLLTNVNIRLVVGTLDVPAFVELSAAIKLELERCGVNRA